jgi:hypothetical protein
MTILNRFANIRSYATVSSKHYPSITPPYHRLIQRLRDGREKLLPSGQRDRLTLAEKIFISHLDDSQFDGSTSHLIRGSSFVKLKPDRVAMQGKLKGMSTHFPPWDGCKANRNRGDLCLWIARCLCADGSTTICDVRDAGHRRADIHPL